MSAQVILRRSLIVVLSSLWCLPAWAQQPEASEQAPAEEPSAEKAPAPAPKTEPSETPQAPIVERVVLGELMAHAVRHADSIKAAQANQRHAGWQQYRAERAWLPKLQANTLLAPVPANTDPNRVSENLDEIFSLNIGPFVRQTARVIIPIYTFGRLSAATDLAQLGVENAAIGVQRDKVELSFQVQRAYYSAQLAAAFDELLKDGDKLLGGKLKEMEDARDFGDADFQIKDYRKLQIFESEFQSRALDNKKLMQMSLAGLKYLTGKDILSAQISPLGTDGALPQLESLKFYQDIAARERPEVKQLVRAVKARQAQVELAKSEFYPNIFFAADLTYGWSTESIAKQPVCRIPQGGSECIYTDDLFARPYSNPYDQFGFGVALGLTWNFDYWQLNGKYREAKAKEEQTYAQRKQALGAIDLEIQKLHLEAQQALEKISIQERRLDAARRWRDQLGLGAQQGGDISEALDPLKAYYEAKLLQLQAVYNYQIARAELAQGIGVSSLSLVEPVTVKK